MDDHEISMFQARVALQYLSDKVNQQADQVKKIEENLLKCQRRIVILRSEEEQVKEMSNTSESRAINDRN